MAGLLDFFFPAAKPLKAAAQGTQAPAPSNSGSGIDQSMIAAQAERDAARAKAAAAPPPAATQGTSSTPIGGGAASRDHYKPRGN